MDDNAYILGYETGAEAGRTEVVNWVKDRLQKYKVAPKLLGFTMLYEDWQAKLKEWGLAPEVKE